MASLSNNCEAGVTGGTNVVVANSATPNAWNVVSPNTSTEGTYYTTQQVAHGNLGIKFITTTVAAKAYVQWTTDGTDEQFVRINFFHNAAPSANGRILQFGNTAGSCLDLELRTDNKMRVRNAYSANQHETPALTVGQWYRIELYGNFIEGTGSSRLRIYKGTDTYTLFDSWDSNADQTLRGTPTYLRFGVIDSMTNMLLFMDDFALRQDAFPGPVVPPLTPPGITPAMYADVTYPMKGQLRVQGLDTTKTYTYTWAVLSGAVGANLGPSDVTLTPSGTDCIVAPLNKYGTAVVRCQVTQVGGGSTNVDHVVQFYTDAIVGPISAFLPATGFDAALSSIEKPLSPIVPVDPPAPPDVTTDWLQNSYEDFNTSAPEGSFLQTYPRWRAYGTNYTTTHGGNGGANNGDHYGGNSNLSTANSWLTMRLYREANGVCSNPNASSGGYTTTSGHAVGAAPYPLLGTTGTSSTQLYGRYEVKYRIRQGVPGWKTAWMLWPGDEIWPAHGEYDWREGDLVGDVHWFHHNMNGTSGGDQVGFKFGTNTNDGAWHTVVLEWKPNNAAVFSDGVLVGRVTNRVVNVPMRVVLQTETPQSGTQPGAAPATAIVDIDYMKTWAYQPGTVVTGPFSYANVNAMQYAQLNTLNWGFNSSSNYQNTYAQLNSLKWGSISTLKWGQL